jgi:WD40 repeat protein
LGEYALAARLGATPLGTVFLGRSAQGRPVALTVLDDRWALDHHARARFTADVTAAGAVSGPRIVPVLDADPTATRPWVVCALPGGPTLAERIADEGPLPADQLPTFARGLAEGLAQVHAAGVVHRDLTPRQVIVGPDGPRVGGFGIAPPVDLDLATRATGMPATTAYLAPEQVGGQQASRASDVFALGGVLFAAATGDAPFGIGPASAVLGRIVRVDCDPARVGHPAMTELVTACLAADPTRRPTADGVARRAEVALTGATEAVNVPVRPRAPETLAPQAVAPQAPPGTASPGAPGPRPHPLQAQARWSEAATPIPPLAQGAIAVRAGAVPAPATSSRTSSRTRRTLAAVTVAVLVIAACTLAWVRFGPGSRHAVAGPAPATSTAPTPTTTAPSTAVGAVQPVTTTASPPITLSTARHILSGHTDFVLGIAYDGAGTRIATAGADRTARIWDATDGRPLRTLTMPTDHWVMAVAFSPNGKLLATGGLDGAARIWDLATGKLVRTLPGHTGGVFALAFSPDGRLLATAAKDRTARLWNVATGKRERELTGHSDGLTGIAFSPDGALVATASADGTARLWHTDTGKPVRAVGAGGHGTAGGLTAVAFSPDGSRLATAGRDGAARLWVTATGAPAGNLTGSGSAVLALAFAGRGALLVTAGGDNTAWVWDLATGATRITVTGHTSWVMGVAVSPDGRTLATASDDKTGRLWDLPDLTSPTTSPTSTSTPTDQAATGPTSTSP